MNSKVREILGLTSISTQSTPVTTPKPASLTSLIPERRYNYSDEIKELENMARVVFKLSQDDQRNLLKRLFSMHYDMVTEMHLGHPETVTKEFMAVSKRHTVVVINLSSTFMFTLLDMRREIHDLGTQINDLMTAREHDLAAQVTAPAQMGGPENVVQEPGKPAGQGAGQKKTR